MDFGLIGENLGDSEQLLRSLNGFFQKSYRPETHREILVFGCNKGRGNKDDGDVACFWVSASLLGECIPVEFGHENVGQNEYGRLGSYLIESFGPISSCHNFVALEFQCDFQQLKNVGYVLDD